MSKKLACIILDALGPYNIRQLDMEYVQSLYNSDEYESDLLGVSGLAHTPISNALMWGDYHNTDKIWTHLTDEQWTGGIDGFDPVEKEYGNDEAELYTREDFDTSFVWDVLDYHSLDVAAVGIPICLPPYCFNEIDHLEDAWFPHTEEHLSTHVREKLPIIEDHTERGDDFICTSIKVPDQWLHSIGTERIDEQFVLSEVPVLEERLQSCIETLESEGYDWLLFGDHGSPIQGRTTHYETKKMLARHRKEALIIGSTDTVPKYTGEMYDFILDYFSVNDVDVGNRGGGQASVDGDVEDRLEAMGYL